MTELGERKCVPGVRRCGYLVVVVQVELDLVIGAQQRALQRAVRQVVGEEQLVENHVVLEHIGVLDERRRSV